MSRPDLNPANEAPAAEVVEREPRMPRARIGDRGRG